MTADEVARVHRRLSGRRPTGQGRGHQPVPGRHRHGLAGRGDVDVHRGRHRQRGQRQPRCHRVPRAEAPGLRGGRRRCRDSVRQVAGPEPGPEDGERPEDEAVELTRLQDAITTPRATAGGRSAGHRAGGVVGRAEVGRGRTASC